MSERKPIWWAISGESLPLRLNTRKPRQLLNVLGKREDLTNRSGAVKSVQGRSPNFPKTSLNEAYQ